MATRKWDDFESWDDFKEPRHIEGYLKDQGERYGIEYAGYQRGDTGSQEADRLEDFKEELFRRAGNDYMSNRSTEAARLSGDEKYQDLPRAITNAEDLFKTNKFMQDTFYEQDLGTNYNSLNDAAAVKDYFVDLDRDTLNALSATEEPTDSPKVAPRDTTVPIEIPEHIQETKDIVDNHDWTDNYYRNALARDHGISPPIPADFLEPYKLNLKSGLAKAGIPTRGLGAVGTIGGLLS